MRVAVIHHQYRISGGMESYLFDLLQGLRDQHDSLDVFVAKRDPACRVPGWLRVHSIPVRFIPHQLRSLVFARRLRQALPLEAFDLVLSLTRTAHQDVTICAGTHRGYLRALGRRPGLFDRLEILLETRGFQHSSQVVVFSQKIANELEMLYGVAPDKVWLLRPPINTTKFHYVAADERMRCRQQLGLNPGKTTLLFPGAGNVRKGYAELLKAFDLLPPQRFELLLTGKHPPRRRGIIRHLGFVKDIRPLYGAVDFTILPSKYESFGLTVAESLQCGTPVIISPQVAAGELLRAEEGLVLTSMEPSEIADGIQRAAAGRHQVVPDFAARNGLTIEQHVNQLRNLRARPRRNDMKCSHPYSLVGVEVSGFEVNPCNQAE